MHQHSGSDEHPFEARGLGRAPFTFDRYERKPGSTCACCGRTIANLYFVRSADGRSSPVGESCVFKTADLELNRAVRDQIKSMRKASAAEQIAWAEDRLAQPEVLVELSKANSPNPWRAREKETARDWCTWMLEHSGTSGKLKVAHFLQQFELPMGDRPGDADRQAP